MPTLRATRDLLRRLGPVTAESRPSATALGDWFALRIVVARRPLILVIASRGYLPILVPARDVSNLPARLPDLVAARLYRAQVPAPLITAEVARMRPMLVGPTNDRSVLGILIEFARMVPLHLDHAARDETALPLVEDALAQQPCHASRRFEEVVFPDRDTLRILHAARGAC